MNAAGRHALLVNPPHAGSYRSAIMRGDSMALASVSQELQALGWTTAVRDLFLRNARIEDLADDVAGPVDAVCVTLMHETAWPLAKRAVSEVRRRHPDVFAVIGGTAVTLNPTRYLEPGSGFDCVYGGTSLGDLPRVLEERRRPASDGVPHVISSGMARPQDLEPLLARPDLERSFSVDRVVCLESSQGCYARCAFCSIYAHHDTAWLTKSAPTVLAEVDAIRRRLPTCSELRFVDANFFGVPVEKSDARALAIGSGLHERGMRFRAECRSNDVREPLFRQLVDHGLTGLFIGLESGLDSVLRAVQKGTSARRNVRAAEILRSLGCSYSIGFMMITADASSADIWENVEFLSRLRNGVRWKHLFSGLIYQEGTKMNRRSLNVLGSNERLEARLGYVPNGELARKLLLIWNAFGDHHRNVLAKEHAIGVCLERGKEARLSEAWKLDEAFGAFCLERYRALLAELESHPVAQLDAETIAGRCARDLDFAFDGLLQKLRRLGLPERVMLTDLRPLFVAPVANDPPLRSATPFA